MLKSYNEVSPGIKFATKENLELLGAPNFEEGFTSHVGKISKITLGINSLENINFHIVFYCEIVYLSLS